MFHVQSKPVKKNHQSQTSYQVQPDGAELGLAQPQLVFFTSADKKGPHKNHGKSIPLKADISNT